MLNRPTVPSPAAPRVLTLADMLAICWRRRWISIPVALLVLAAVIGSTWLRTPLYKATASLAVEKGARAMAILADGEERVEFGFLNTERDRLLSDPVLSRVVETAKLRERAPYDASNTPTNLLRSRIEVATSRDSWVLVVSLLDERPGDARDILRTLVESYLDIARSERANMAGSAVRFFDAQIEKTRGELARHRAAETTFRADNQIFSSDPDRNPHVVTVDNVSRALLDAEVGRAALGSVQAQVEAARAIGEAEERRGAFLRIARIGRDPQVMAVGEQLRALEFEDARLRYEYGPRHPRLALQEQAVQAKSAQLDEVIALVVDALAGEIAQRDHELGALRTRLGQAREELTSYRSRLVELETIRQQTASQERLLEQLLRRRGEEEVASQRFTTNVALIDPPRASLAPTNVHRKATALVAVGLSALALVVSALLAEALDRRIRNLQDVQRLTVAPVIGQVPHLRGNQSRTLADRDPDIAEAFRELATSIHLGIRRTGRAVVVVVAGPAPGDGASTVASQLAVTLAENRWRVLLVDANLRRPALHSMFGVGLGYGLSFILSQPDRDVVTVRTFLPSLDLVTAGACPPNPPALLSNDDLPSALEAMRSEYDVVVVDVPPLSLVSDGLLLANHADGVLLVLREGRTPKGAVRQALERLAASRTLVLGLVLNGVRRALDLRAQGYSYNAGAPVPDADSAVAPASRRMRRLVDESTIDDAEELVIDMSKDRVQRPGDEHARP